MKLLPSLKQKKRYLVFEILSDAPCAFSEVQKAVNAALLSFLGQWGTAKAAPLLIKEKYKNNKFILKVNHTMGEEAKAALLFISAIADMPVIIRSVITAGTIKKASTYL